DGQPVDLGTVRRSYIDQIQVPLAKKSVTAPLCFRARRGQGPDIAFINTVGARNNQRPPVALLASPLGQRILKEELIVVTWRNMEGAIKRPQVRDAADVGGKGIVNEPQYFDWL